MGEPLSRPVGVHAPVAGGLATAALRYVDAARAEAVQVFVGNPRGWALSAGDPAQDAAFRDGCGSRGVPAFIHATLLVNVASPTAETVTRSAETIAHSLMRATAIGARGVVYHAGSAVDATHVDRAYAQLREALLPILDAAPAEGPRLLVEPSAGGGRSLAARVEDLAAYFAALDDHPLLGVCLDTCHAWAAGHEISSPEGMTGLLEVLERTVPGRLGLIHANDAKDPRGSTRDRHENIGAGAIGRDPFAAIFTHATTVGVPLIVETPSTGYAGHAADVATLTSLRAHHAP